MSKPSDESLDQEHRSDGNAPEPESTTKPPATTTAGNEPELPSTTTAAAAAAAANPPTAAEYIYRKMIPPKQQAVETAEVSLGKRERCNTGGSTRSLLSGGAGPMMSMDLFLSGDIDDDARMRIQSSEFVKDILLPEEEAGEESRLPDIDATAAAALNAEEEYVTPLSKGNDEKPSSIPEQEAEDDYEFRPVLDLTTKLERMSTGDSVAPLGEDFRISSRDWVKDFQAESAGMGATPPTLFMEHAASNPSLMKSDKSLMKDYEAGASTAPIPVNASQAGYSEYEVPLHSSGHQPLPPLSNSNVLHNLPATSPTSSLNKKGTSPNSSTTSKKNKKSRRRVIDASRPIEPTDDDVLFGRGGYTNTHPGNIRFREKALELRGWYETVSKEEKYNISNILIESVTGEGHRFLEKGKDGLWYEVVGNGARKKASQALRERIKGKRKSAASSSGTRGNLASSIRSTGSAAGGGGGAGGHVNVNVEEDLEELEPANVVGV